MPSMIPFRLLALADGVEKEHHATEASGVGSHSGASPLPMATIDLTHTKERLPGPFPANRLCSDCGAKLSRYNPSEKCAPCGGWPRARMVRSAEDLAELMAS